MTHKRPVKWHFKRRSFACVQRGCGLLASHRGHSGGRRSLCRLRSLHAQVRLNANDTVALACKSLSVSPSSHLRSSYSYLFRLLERQLERNQQNEMAANAADGELGRPPHARGRAARQPRDYAARPPPVRPGSAPRRAAPPPQRRAAATPPPSREAPTLPPTHN